MSNAIYTITIKGMSNDNFETINTLCKELGLEKNVKWSFSNPKEVKETKGRKRSVEDNIKIYDFFIKKGYKVVDINGVKNVSDSRSTITSKDVIFSGKNEDKFLNQKTVKKTDFIAYFESLGEEKNDEEEIHEVEEENSFDKTKWIPTKSYITDAIYGKINTPKVYGIMEKEEKQAYKKWYIETKGLKPLSSTPKQEMKFDNNGLETTNTASLLPIPTTIEQTIAVGTMSIWVEEFNGNVAIPNNYYSLSKDIQDQIITQMVQNRKRTTVTITIPNTDLPIVEEPKDDSHLFTDVTITQIPADFDFAKLFNKLSVEEQQKLLQKSEEDLGF